MVAVSAGADGRAVGVVTAVVGSGDSRCEGSGFVVGLAGTAAVEVAVRERVLGVLGGSLIAGCDACEVTV